MMSAEIRPVPDSEFVRPRSRFVKLSSLRSSKPKPDEEKKKQVQDYVMWVNTYLRDMPGSPQITDLRTSMQDGITLVNLVEAAAKSEIPFVNRKPSSSSARRSNIEKAVAFLKSDGANLIGDPVKDIHDGSIKGIMRVVLAIAEKYKPNSVRPIAHTKSHNSTSSSSSSQQQQQQQLHLSPQAPANPQSQTHPIPVAQGRSPERMRNKPPLAPSSSSPRGTSPVPQSHPLPVPQSHSLPVPQSHPLPISQYNGSSMHSPGFTLSQGYPHSQGFGNTPGIGMTGDIMVGGTTGGGYSLSQPVSQMEDIYTEPIDSLPQNMTQRISSQMPVSRVIGQQKKHKAQRLSVPVPARPSPLSPQQPAFPNIPEELDKEAVKSESKPQESPRKTINNLLVYEEINGALSQLGDLKIELLKLHTTLLDNVADGEVSAETADLKLPLEVANSEILTKDKELMELQEEMEKTKEVLAKAESECETLKEMVLERNQFITGMKTEIYRKEYRNDTEKVDLQTQLLHKEKKIKILEAEVSLMKASVEGKDREVSEMRKKIMESESRESELSDEVMRISSELSRAVEAEESLQAKIFSRDRKIAHLEEKLEAEKGLFQRVDPSIVSEEMDSIREMLGGLRGSMDASSPNQQTMDTLEKNISNMITKITDHVRSLSPGRRPRRHHDGKKRHHRDRGESRSSKDETERAHYSSSNPGEWTKVFYYITGDKMETPYVTSVPRKASEVRLKDFKAVFDRHGSYRFYFKTEDPDCGVVREEIIDDDHILPAWNGKIMVWVTEKAHHR